MLKYMVFPQKLSAPAQLAPWNDILDKTILLSLSAETTIYISSKLMVNLGNIYVFRGAK